MAIARKITVEVSPELLDRAQRASGTGITETVRTGLQLVAHRGPTPACANSVARFASPALWQRSKPTDDRG
jgi:hypothetical protein